MSRIRLAIQRCALPALLTVLALAPDIIVIDRANPDAVLLVFRIFTNSQLDLVIRVLMSAGIGRGMTFLN